MTFSYRDRTIQIDPESNLGVKLIHDKGEIEAFYYATKIEMINYSTVSKYPEILLIIDQFVKEYFGEYTNFDYSLVIAPVVADLCTTPVALSAPPNSFQNNSQS